MANCRWCNIDLSTTRSPPNHTRWCTFNPKVISGEHKNHLNYARASISVESRLAANEKIKKKHAAGDYKGSRERGHKTRKLKGNAGHTEETKKKLSELALRSKHRRVQKSTRPYTRKDGTVVLLDSSWEEALARRLDDLLIDWIRPSPLEWVDCGGKTHNYFPDFYLTKFDVYLDPKNPEVFRRSAEKITVLVSTYSNIRFLKTLEECKNFSI